MKLTLERHITTAVEPSPNVLRVAAMFGLGVDERRSVAVVPRVELDLRPSQIVFVTGPSGGGKTSLLRAIGAQLDARDDAEVIRYDALPDPPDAPLVDGFGGLSLDRALRVLSLAGLSDAFVMLRRPAELSDGQRYRLRLAQMIAHVETMRDGHVHPTGACGKGAKRRATASVSGVGCGTLRFAAGTPGTESLAVVIADEFGATLDRITAKVVAHNFARWARRAGVCLIAATTHDDLLDALEPDVLVEKGLGEAIEVVAHASSITESTETRRH